MVRFDDEKQKQQFQEFREKEEKSLVQALSLRYGLPYVDLGITPINNAAVGAIDEKTAREASMGAFEMKNNRLDVAILSPHNERTTAALADLERKGYKVAVYMTTESQLKRLWDRYKDLAAAHATEAGMLNIGAASMEDLAKGIKTAKDASDFIAKLTAEKGAHRITKIFEVIVAGAFALNVSDIHFEAQKEDARIRYRLDGVLHDVTNIDPKTYHLLLARLKLLSGLKLNVQAEMQDGRFSVTLSGTEIQIRTSVAPGAFGENAVLRLLNPQSISVPLQDLGMDDALLEVLLREIHKPNGMILTTGPTGSGKTTTLYAFLRETYSPEIKVMTIEDPVEYHLKGVAQTQVEKQKGYTFLSGLRAALRQDPDIIMIGEIRDDETASIAIDAAMTGHLVFSTLHTNNAAGAIPRLIDLKVNPKVIGSALSAAMAQRLMRKLCTECKKSYEPSTEERAIVDRVLAGVEKKRGKKPAIGSLWKSGGCNACNHIGYKGRIGVYEAILMDAKIEALVTQNPSEREIIEASIDQGILDMREDGILKVLQGVTSLEELRRVVEL